jgi:RNA polymerase primary sigma factor
MSTTQHYPNVHTTATKDTYTPENLLTHEEEIACASDIAFGRIAQQTLKSSGTLSLAERAELEQLAARGIYARDQLIIRNQGLVGKVARRYFDSGLEFDDLMQEGQIGLIKAAERYDPQMGTRFSTYAVWWIRQTIGRAISNTGRMVRLPVNLGQRVLQLRRASAELQQTLGRTATDEELANYLHWSFDKVQSTHESVVPVSRLEQLISNSEGDDTELQELISDDNVISPEDQIEHQQMVHEIHKALEQLGDWEAKILRLRYGFVDGQPRALSELAREFGMSREGMRQVANRAMEQIRRSQVGANLSHYVSNY